MLRHWPAQPAGAQAISARIGHTRACAGTRNLAYVGKKQWMADRGRQRPSRILCQPEDFGASISRPPDGLGHHVPVHVPLTDSKKCCNNISIFMQNYI